MADSRASERANAIRVLHVDDDATMLDFEADSDGYGWQLRD